MGILSKLFGKNKNNKEENKKDAFTLLLQDVELAPGIVLPKVLESYWPQLQTSKRTCISIKATPAESFTLQQSKFYHYPCIPKNFQYPVDKNGNYMIPLAQINFSECPLLPMFPSSGYLQFYIADDDMYGMDFDNQLAQTGFRVLFFKEEDVKEPLQDFSFLDKIMASENTPVYKPHELNFSLKDEIIGMCDCHSETFMASILKDVYSKHPGIEDDLSDILFEKFQCNGHKLGGYAYFTQSDPRANTDNRILLFQLDSDDEIMWGDVGVANFFIHPEDLKQLNFSRIMYNWDCC